MSTFNGICKEFPQIRIDYFRVRPGKPAPLACFLSHVHSDHLQGLESLKSPFVYCSAATKRLLLRIEKYPHRLNFAKGILEARKQHYKHLRLVLKALPLETPTELELGPKIKIRVTLFDANHCPGAVVFLIEGDGKAILYTGDIRAEPWWLDCFARNPILIPYTLGNKILDCVYLDTTFATHDDAYRDFPPKSEGLVELIKKVQSSPPDAVFYFRAWTLGYEDVWLALSAALESKVHVDDYQTRLYGSLVDDTREGVAVAGGPALSGFQAGNHYHAGCLTMDSNVRIHSCEPGTLCHANLAKKKNVIWITPIISRTGDGVELRELGAGGGGGDLYQVSELDMSDDFITKTLEEYCTSLITEPDVLARTLESVAAMHGSRNPLLLQTLGFLSDAEISLKDFVRTISRKGEHIGRRATDLLQENIEMKDTIHFPYSRHSSYGELRQLIARFRPKDICPCTVDKQSWSNLLSMESLFEDLCSEQNWHHDQQTRVEVAPQHAVCMPKKRKRETDDEGTQTDEVSNDLFESAQDFPERGAREELDDRTRSMNRPTSLVITQPPVPFDHRHEQSPADSESTQHPQLLIVRDEFRNMNGGSDMLHSHAQAGTGSSTNLGQDEDSQLSLTSTTFDSQSQDKATENISKNRDNVRESELDIALDGQKDGVFWNQEMSNKETRTGQSLRSLARKEAYKAARLLLLRSDSGPWEDLGSRLMGRHDHGEEEVEL